MQVSVENTGALQRRMTVQVPADEVESQVDGRMKELGKSVRLKGFRPGRVPRKVLEQRFGKQVRQEVVGQLVQETFREALVQEKLRPAVTPDIATEPPKARQDLEYIATFDVYPELEPVDLSELKLVRPEAEVDDGDIDRMIETLREQRRGWQETEEPAKDGDLVLLDFYAVPAEGDRYPEEDAEKAGTILGSGMLPPALESALVGLKAGETKTLSVDFPEDFRTAELAGKTAETHVELSKVQTPELPEVDADFMASFGVEGGDMDAFRSEVRQNLERELDQALRGRARDGAVEALLQKFPDIAIPAGMVDTEMNRLHQQAQQQAERTKAPVPEPASFREQADKRVRSGLILAELARQAEVQVDGRRVREVIETQASTFENPAEIVNLYYGNEQLLDEVQNQVIEEQVVTWVFEQADVSTESKTFDDIMRPSAGQE